MKATTNTATKEFEPIHLNITIENKDELLFLWHLFNLSSTDKTNLLNNANAKSSNSNVPIPNTIINTTSVWQQLNKFV
jgi:hypothetical protein